MKNVSRRIKGILLASMYIALYYVVSFVVYNIYIIWLVAADGLSLLNAEKTAINSSYVLTAVVWAICLWLFMLIGKFRNKPLKKAIEVKKMPLVIYEMVFVLAIGCRLLVAVYYSVSQNIDVLEQSIERAAGISPEINTVLQSLLATCCIVFIAPFFEELLFRVLVMGELLKVMRPWAAIVTQAAAFGVVHGLLFQSIFAFVIGIMLGIVYYKTQNIKVAAVCHSVFNFSTVLMQENLTSKGIVVFVIAGILLISLSIFYIVANCKREET